MREYIYLSNIYYQMKVPSLIKLLYTFTTEAS